MGVIEIEVWTEAMDADYARLLSELDDETAGELYEHLYSRSIEWCNKHGVSPQLYRRTTGRHVRLADVLQWYEEEGLLTEIKVDGETAYLPIESVQDELDRPIPVNSLVPIDE